MEKCPITGLECTKEKCIHITDVHEYSAVETMDMCSFCGVPFISEGQPTDHTALMNFIQKLTGAVPVFENLNAHINKPNVKQCHQCGYTLYDFVQAGKLGCGTCYKVFKEEIKPLIFNCHKSLQHKGKKPLSVPQKPLTKDLNQLNAEMQTAIKKENYELAAELKKEIDKLQQ